jgi:hypothetical protein
MPWIRTLGNNVSLSVLAEREHPVASIMQSIEFPVIEAGEGAEW